MQPIDFDIVPGNYYQIMDWFKKGSIDAAIVSAMMGKLLVEDGFPAFELSEITNDLERPMEGHPPDGHWPFVAVMSKTVIENKSDPAEFYDSFLKCIYNTSKDRLRNLSNGCEKEFHLNLVSHLSSTAFIAPFLHATEWLSKQLREDHLSKDQITRVKDSFWTEFFRNVEFQFDHASDHLGPCNEGSIFFTFSSANLQPDTCLSQWTKLQEHRESRQAPIPNNLLIFNLATARRILNDRRILHQEDLAHWIPDPSDMKRIFHSSHGYVGIALYNGRRHQPFWDSINAAFNQSATLKEYYRKWYQEGRYDFTIEDTLRFLLQDQHNSNLARLSLVLPGGGVKSAYQAKMLDLLYENHNLINEGEHEAIVALKETERTAMSSGKNNLTEREMGSSADTDIGPITPLVVNEIVGTSGGAMVGMFAALLHDTKPNAEQLTSLWRNSKNLILSSHDVYALLDSPRWFSFLTILVIFAVVISLARQLHFLGLSRLEPVRFSSHPIPWLYWALYFLVLAVPAALFYLSGPYRENIHWTEGIALFAFLFLTNLIVNCVGIKSDAPLYSPPRVVYLFFIIGFLLVVAPLLDTWTKSGILVVKMVDSDLLLRNSLFMSGLIVLLLGIIALAYTQSMRLILEDLDGHFGRWIMLLMAVGLTYFFIAVAVGLDQATLLELTDQFWIVLFLAAASTSVLMVIIGISKDTQASKLKFLRRGLVAVAEDHILGERYSRKPLLLIITLFGTGFFLWYYHDAPAIYGNRYALEFFKAKLDKALNLKDQGTSPLYANLTVTATSLDTVRISDRDLEPGGIYFSFRRINRSNMGFIDYSDVPFENNRIFIHRNYDKDFRDFLLNAVFASGSPSPIFPAHAVNVQGADFHLIDGGYVHTVPLEGAKLINARQVLLLRSSPDIWREGHPTPSDLRVTPTNTLRSVVAKLLPFLFDQAQEIDKSVASDMVVASISPHAENQPFPFLADFRSTQVSKVIQSAKNDYDIKRRVGLVESWGAPPYSIAIRGGFNNRRRHLHLTGTGWLHSVRTSLMKRITEREEQISESGSNDKYIAFVELDHACFANNIVGALLARMIMDQAYPGDSEDFWNAVERPAIREDLSDYWKSHHGEPLPRDPRMWSSEFRDYFVMFYGEYEDRAKVNMELADEWAAKLLAFLPSDTMESIIRKVWDQNPQHQSKPLDILSVKYTRKVTIYLQVNLYDQMRELLQELNSLGWHVYGYSSASEYLAKYVLDNLLGASGTFTAVGPPSTGNNGHKLRNATEEIVKHASLLVGTKPYNFVAANKEPTRLIISKDMVVQRTTTYELLQPRDLFLKTFIPAISFDVGNKYDASFNQSALIEADQYKDETGFSYLNYEPKYPEDREVGLETLAQKKANLIVALGAGFELPIKKVANKYPDIQFVILDKALSESISIPPNLRSISFAEHEASFLAGHYAASKNNARIGFIAGRQLDSINSMLSGYIAGAKMRSPTIEIVGCSIGTNDSAWTNQSGGEQAARHMLSKGIDVIFVAAGKANLGVYHAGHNHNRAGYDIKAKIIGSDLIQEDQFPNTIIGTVTKDTGRIVKQMFRSLTPPVNREEQDDKFDWSFRTRTLGLERQDVDFVMTRRETDHEEKQLIGKLREGIINGLISINRESHELPLCSTLGKAGDINYLTNQPLALVDLR
jgi:basic membrane protein A